MGLSVPALIQPYPTISLCVMLVFFFHLPLGDANYVTCGMVFLYFFSHKRFLLRKLSEFFSLAWMANNIIITVLIIRLEINCPEYPGQRINQGVSGHVLILKNKRQNFSCQCPFKLAVFLVLLEVLLPPLEIRKSNRFDQ
jgi:hypothetical protein